MKPLVRCALLGLLFMLAAQFAPAQTAQASPGGYPPDLVAPFYGNIRLRVLRGATEAVQHLYLTVTDGAGSVTYYLGELTATNTTLNTDIAVTPGDRLDVWLFTSHMQPQHLPVSYHYDRVTRPGEPEPRILAHYQLPGGPQHWCGQAENAWSTPLNVTALFNTAEHLLALACWEDWYDFDHNDFAVAVDYVPGSIVIPDPILTVDYPWLVWYGPQVGQPTQVLRGTGFTPGGAATVTVSGPGTCGAATYPVTADATGAWTLSAAGAGDAWFGVACRGAWQAAATDVASGLGSNAVAWTVAWFPVHRVR